MQTEEHRGRLLPVHLIKRIFRLKRENVRISEIATIVGVHRETVYRYVRMTPAEQMEAIAAAAPRPFSA